VSPFEQKVLLYLLIGTWATIVPTLAGALWWFVKKDRTAFFGKLRTHEQRLDDHAKEIGDLNTAVFGHDGSSGVSKWEHRARTLLTPVVDEIHELGKQLGKLKLVIARIPGVDIKDIP